MPFPDRHISSDGRRSTQQSTICGNAAASVTGIPHHGQPDMTDMIDINIGCAAKAAFISIVAWIAQMARNIGLGTTVFTGIAHDSLLSLHVQSNDIQYDDGLRCRQVGWGQLSDSR